MMAAVVAAASMVAAGMALAVVMVMVIAPIFRNVRDMSILPPPMGEVAEHSKAGEGPLSQPFGLPALPEGEPRGTSVVRISCLLSYHIFARW